ncbi:class I SAM-dependent methyltransferase [Candidatus Shapirobacteria bacterium]|nr:class I SAM-dependent methyltransferase [Candidatus Shapirobacteria bacterium]
MSKINDVLFYYKKKANFTDQVSEPFQQEIIKKWLISLSRGKKINNWKVLDFGSGLGCNLITLKKFFKTITTCDINKTALNLSQKNYGVRGINYILLDGLKLPFENKTFDLIVATEVFEHILNFKKMISELKRVIKEKGFLIISTPNYFNPTGIIKKFNDFKNRNQAWGPWGGHHGGLERFTTWLNVEKMLYDFRIISSRGADYQKSWFYNNPLFPVRFSKYILIWPGRLPLIKKLGMNYFILAQKE